MLQTTQLEKPDNGKVVRHYLIFWQLQDNKESKIRILKTILSKNIIELKTFMKTFIIENIYRYSENDLYPNIYNY